MATDIRVFREMLPKFLTRPDPSVYLTNNYVVLDFETTNLDKGSPYNHRNSIVSVAWYCGSGHPDYAHTMEYRTGTEYEMQDLVEACEKADFIVAHNTKFELGWLERCGLPKHKVLPYCTMLGDYVRAGNRRFKLSLNGCLKRYGLGSKIDVVGKLMDAGMCPSTISPALLKKYCKRDVWQTHRLFLRQRRLLAKRGLLPSAFTRNIFTPALVEIEKNGMHLDEDRVNILHRKMVIERDNLQRQLDLLTGGVNFRSGKQMANYLFKELKFKIPLDYKKRPIVNKPTADWPDGRPKTDKATIAKLVPRSAKQRKFLELLTATKKLDSSITKFIGKMAACVAETEDNILYARMNQTTTKTHRLSSSGLYYALQFHNFDRRFKPLFSPRHEGWLFGEADEAQLEYRTAVFLGNDEVGRQDIADNVDAHGITASIVFDEEWEACGGDRHSTVGKKLRTAAKSDTFKPLYGGKSGTEKQKAYYEFFMEKHKGIADIQQEWISTVYRTKELETITGLKFYWHDSRVNMDGTLIRPDGRPADQSVCNYPVQSLATAEIVPIGVTYLFHYMQAAKMESLLVNTVHDSALAELNPDERELFSIFAVQSMEKEVITYLDEVYGIDFDVPLEAEIEVNSHWANSEDWEEEYLNAA